MTPSEPRPATVATPANPLPRMFWQLVRARPWLYLALVLTLGAFLVGRLVPGLLEQSIFNSLTSGADAERTAWSLIALMVSLELARLVFSFGAAITDVTNQYSAAARIQGNLLRRLLRLPGAAALRDSPGETLSRFRDDVQDVIVFYTAPVTLLGTTVFSVIAVIAMLRINVELTIVVTLPLFAVIAAATVANNRVRGYRLASREATANIVGFLGEALGSAQSVKLLGASRHVRRRFDVLSERRRVTSVRDGVFTQILTSIFSNAVDLGVGLMLLLIVAPMTHGTFTVGDFALFDYYLFFVTRLPLTIGSTLVQYRQATVAATRLVATAQDEGPDHLTADPPPPRQRTTVAEPFRTLTARGLTYRFPGSDRGVFDVDLAIRRGTLTVITGRVGSGKTTLLRALLGLLPRDAGLIRWNGVPVDDPAAFFVPPRTAYVPQLPGLAGDTVRENILLGLDETQVDLTAAIRAAALTDDIAGWADGLDTVVGPSGAKVSGGQAQRLATARMFVREARLMVIDDFASAVDLDTEQALLGAMTPSPDRTFLVSSHRKAVLARADRIVLLREGRVHAVGGLSELLDSSAEMRDVAMEAVR